MVYIELTLSPDQVYIDLDPWHFGIFAMFSWLIQVKIKKVLPFELGAPGTVPYVKSALVIALRS